MSGPRKRSLWNGTYSTVGIGEAMARTREAGFKRGTPCRLTPHQFLQGEQVRVCSVCGHTEALDPARAFMAERPRRAPQPPLRVLFHCKVCGRHVPGEQLVVTGKDRRGICAGCVQAVKQVVQERHP